MVIRTKFKTMQDNSMADTRNRYDYILACEHKKYFSPVGTKMHDMVT